MRKLSAGSRTGGTVKDGVLELQGDQCERALEVLGVMRGLAEDGMTMIVVTYEIAFARDAGDSVAFMDGGVVVEQGPPREVLAAPRHERTRSFLARVLGAQR